MQISDGEDRLLYGNSACERVLGFTSQDLFMRNTWDLQTTIGLTELSLAEEGKVLERHWHRRMSLVAVTTYLKRRFFASCCRPDKPSTLISYVGKVT